MHLGHPDVPRTKRSTQEVQSEKAAKAQVQVERVCLCEEMIQATAKLETHLQEQQLKRLATAHRPLASSQKKVLHGHSKAHTRSTEAAVRGMYEFPLTVKTIF